MFSQIFPGCGTVPLLREEPGRNGEKTNVASLNPAEGRSFPAGTRTGAPGLGCDNRFAFVRNSNSEAKIPAWVRRIGRPLPLEPHRTGSRFPCLIKFNRGSIFATLGSQCSYFSLQFQSIPKLRTAQVRARPPTRSPDLEPFTTRKRDCTSSKRGFAPNLGDTAANPANRVPAFYGR